MTERIKPIPTDPRNFETAEGDVLPKADLTNDMEWDSPGAEVAGELVGHVDQLAGVSVRSTAHTRRPNHRGGRSYPEISARDMGRAIDKHVAACEEALERPLTEQEWLKESRFVEQVLRGFYDYPAIGRLKLG